jgi:NAD(P)-dependent dehydrogenase (short-subunit alcohol dehydrogenase family)
MADRIWFITGASSGFGRELAKVALDSGDRVIGAARRKQEGDALLETARDRYIPVVLDVTDGAAGARAIQDTLKRFGRIDVLVNNAGHTQVGAVEETTEEELRSLFELHFFGPVALVRAVLPEMRKRRSGWIVQISSVGGRVAGPGFSAYCATKFALEGYSDTLASEVEPFGIRVLVVEPGAFRTNLFDPQAAKTSESIPGYEATVGKTREYLKAHGTQPGDPAKAARAILQAIESPRPPLRLPLGADALEWIQQVRDREEADHREWESVIRGTDFDSPRG